MVTTPTSRQNIPGRDYGVIVLFILAAVVVGVVVTWYLATEDSDSVTTTEVAPAATAAVSTSAEADTTARGGLAEAWDPQAPSTAVTSAEPVAVYVVASEESADLLRMMMGESDAIRASLGLPPLESRFVVLPSGVDAWAMFREEQAIRAAEGMSEIQVFDMRPAVAEELPGPEAYLPVEPYVPGFITP